MRRWSELTGAERIELYTRLSLYFVVCTFNLSVVAAALRRIDDGGERAGVVAGAVVVTALGYVAMRALLGRYPSMVPRPWPALGALAVAALAFSAYAAAAWGDDAAGTAAMVSIAPLVLAVGLLPGRAVGAGLVLLGGALFFAVSGELAGLGAGLLYSAALLFTVRASLWVLGVVTELDAARQAQARLAVVEERLRFSRDVHDVLGRRLSTIAVQAELAATLADRGDERAAERMLEVRGVAHEALREARELARGYRHTDFGQELEGARSLLRSAGIDVHLDVDGLPRGWEEAAAWVVRESVTNVLRHSSARTVEVAYAGERLTVASDGARRGGPEAADGTGLRDLRQRLAPLGATLDAAPGGDGRWLVTATLPGEGPHAAVAG